LRRGFREPEELKHTPKEAAGYVTTGAEDVGYADFYNLAFRLFGFSAFSTHYLYMTLLALSFALFAIVYRRDRGYPLSQEAAADAAGQVRPTNRQARGGGKHRGGRRRRTTFRRAREALQAAIANDAAARSCQRSVRPAATAALLPADKRAGFVQRVDSAIRSPTIFASSTQRIFGL
jgi:hypothetical protein